MSHELFMKENASTEAGDAISSISAIAYGFMGSQALFAALELGLFTALSDEPGGLDALAVKLHAPVGPLSVLLSTCLALRLLTRDGERYYNSPAAQRFLVQSARSYVGDYYLRQISPIIYTRLREWTETVIVLVDHHWREHIAEYTRERGSVMTTPFRAFVVNQSADGFEMGIQRLEQRDLPPGDVLIQVAYAAVNYKDALACIPNGNVARIYPLVPGLELTGVVVESTDPRFKPDDRVLAFDFGSTQGISRLGGYSEYARVPGDFVFCLPAGVDFKQAHVLSAGMTAAMGLRQLEKNDLTPERGPVLVTGATGGVGSLAVSLLSRRGYTVAASTGKADTQHYLRRLGASEILSREEISAESARPLEAERWAGSIDNVGGATLAYLMRTTKKGGAIAAIGVSGGAAFRATVFPLILRGIKVLGIDMPSTPLQMRRELWEEVIRETALLSLVDSIVSEVTLEDIPRVTKAMLSGQTRGRILARGSSTSKSFLNSHRSVPRAAIAPSEALAQESG